MPALARRRFVWRRKLLPFLGGAAPLRPPGRNLISRGEACTGAGNANQPLGDSRDANGWVLRVRRNIR